MARQFTDEELAKLPKWAQQRITTLHVDLDFLRAKLAVGPEDSDTFADPFSEPPRPLGKGVTVRFCIDGDEDRAFDVRMDEGNLRVHGRTFASEHFAVLPRVSNSVDIIMVPRT